MTTFYCHNGLYKMNKQQSQFVNNSDFIRTFNALRTAMLLAYS